MFVWTAHDVIDVIALGVVLISAGAIGILMLVSNVADRWRKWRKS